jgi:hypothetical protein
VTLPTCSRVTGMLGHDSCVLMLLHEVRCDSYDLLLAASEEVTSMCLQLDRIRV